ncbi:glycoside hydrolase family 43 protein [Pelagicoccus enzymogenes]|uniref:glycoside hydrolase family 43 protein n=1 Tax=Pelagicoccus enzymogenes TaxID=2773457 RepID=UPI00280D2966|nr:glycoside hydrolase family 43 protein [Pelagicoccus enzymogenes]MDQ8197706.1 glycoside hydrolase family 43 protein [Pelagicoccus enzymogenes]
MGGIYRLLQFVALCFSQRIHQCRIRFNTTLAKAQCYGFAFASIPFASAEVPEKAYLFPHFYWNGDSGMHLAWSRDGLSWELLNDGKSMITPVVGESKLLRDPSVARGPDGTYHMVWTDSWGSKTIGYASTKDFINWSEQKTIPVMVHEEGAQNSWAPEVFWDPDAENFIILWSTTLKGEFPETALSNRRPTRNHRIYCTTTEDFEHFAPTRLYYDGGFNVIDAVLAKDGADWLMFVKHEQLSPTTQKNIRLVRGKTSHGPFSAPSDPISGDYWAEGPSPFKLGDYWYVYFDKHMFNAYGAVRSGDLENWEDVSETLSFPKDVRHGCFIEVDRSILEPLLAL